MTIPLLSSWSIIYKPGKYYIYVVSLVLAPLFSDFDTLHEQEKMGMVFRTFAILTLPCYLVLNKKMLDLTERAMFQKVGTVFDPPVTCWYDVVLMEQYFVK